MCYCEFLMLHSTRPTRFPFFTFQNVSINTERTGISENAVHPSRFHYVSIKTKQEFDDRMERYDSSHSTMFLLLHVLQKQTNILHY